MKMLPKPLLAAFTVGLLAGCTCGDRRLCEGTEPKVSPDGAWIVFQRIVDGRNAVGRMRADGSGSVDWIKKDAGDGCHPCWGPDGSVIYTSSDEREPALVAQNRGKKSGYNLCRWTAADGERPLTTGRNRDYAASYSPVTKKYYYTSTDFPCRDSKGRKMYDRAALFSLAAASGAKGELLLNIDNYNSAIVSPSLSPDGQRFVWAFRNGFWRVSRIAVAPVGSPKDFTEVSSENLFAYAPAWSPDGQTIAFTATEYGQPWGVYLMDATTFAARRLCDGRHPSFAPDGQAIYYDRDGVIYRKELKR